MIRASMIASLVLTGLVSAQASSSIFVPDNNASTGGGNVIPFGTTKTSTTWGNQKYQTLIPASYAKGVPVTIRDLGFAPGSTNLHNFDKLTIRMCVVPLTQTQLSLTFASNITKSVQTVLDAKDYTWQLKTSTWSRIGLQKSFLWVPALGNLVIEIECHGTGGFGSSSTGGFRTGNAQRMYIYGWTGTPPTTGRSSNNAVKIELVTTDADASAFGQGCKGSNGVPTLSFTGAPTIGNSFVVNVANAKASTVALHILGLNSAAPLFPLDLKPFGAGGCPLYISPDLPFTAPTGTGTFSIKLPVPNDANLVGSRFWNQFFVLDTGVYKLPYVASNFGRVLIGK